MREEVLGRGRYLRKLCRRNINRFTFFLTKIHLVSSAYVMHLHAHLIIKNFSIKHPLKRQETIYSLILTFSSTSWMPARQEFFFPFFFFSCLLLRFPVSKYHLIPSALFISVSLFFSLSFAQTSPNLFTTQIC